MTVIKLSEKDRCELVKLYEDAETTPMIAMSVADGIAGRDWSAQAWNRVRTKMDEFGEKYGFNPAQMRGINKKTGEVII